MSALYASSGVDDSQISPSDAVVTLRSLPRRFAAALALPEDEQRPDDVLHRRPASGGLSAIEHAAYTAAALPHIADALRLVLSRDNPEVAVPPLEVDPPVDGGSASADEVVEQMAAAAEALAKEISNVSGSEWIRPGRVGAQTVNALDLARAAVQLAIFHLRAAERTIATVVRENR
jgi:hypothetical protein